MENLPFIVVLIIDLVDVYRIPTDRHTVPPLAHGAVGRSEGLAEPHLLHLEYAGGDGGWSSGCANRRPS